MNLSVVAAVFVFTDDVVLVYLLSR